MKISDLESRLREALNQSDQLSRLYQKLQRDNNTVYEEVQNRLQHTEAMAEGLEDSMETLELGIKSSLDG